LRNWLIVARMRKGYSQKKMSELVGISQPSYCAYEKGKTTPRPRHAQKIAKILGFSWEEFFKEDTKGA